MKTYDWSKPQRQPVAGLVVVFINTFWEIIKRLWPFIILMLLGNNEGKVNRYEILAVVLLGITIINALFSFLYFRFYMEEGKLIIKKGWLKKETRVIPLEKIQTVHIEQGPVHQVLNIVKLSIDTAGSQKTEATIDAMHKSMAESLKQQLLSGKKIISDEGPKETIIPVIKLDGNDLLKLSISANHVEAFFILLTFVFGLYENFESLIEPRLENDLPQGTFFTILFLIISVLIITILVSTARIVFSFFNFTMLRVNNGFHIRSGITHIKERVVSLQKIQYISWKANWIRKKMKLWMLEYHVAGGNEKETSRAKIPVTKPTFLPLLIREYHEIPSTNNLPAIRMQPAYIMQRLMITGLPALILFGILWFSIGFFIYSLLILVIPVITGIAGFFRQHKFRLWVFEDVVYISRGILGDEFLFLKWHKIQSVQLLQSSFQRKRGLASLIFHTAGGNIRVNYISLGAARQLMNYSLYKTESFPGSWN